MRENGNDGWDMWNGLLIYMVCIMTALIIYLKTASVLTLVFLYSNLLYRHAILSWDWGSQYMVRSCSSTVISGDMQSFGCTWRQFEMDFNLGRFELKGGHVFYCFFCFFKWVPGKLMHQPSNGLVLSVKLLASWTRFPPSSREQWFCFFHHPSAIGVWPVPGINICPMVKKGI